MNLLERNKLLAKQPFGKDDIAEETRLENLFFKKVETLPQRGTGLHAAILAACNIGIMAGISDSVILSTLKSSSVAGDVKRNEFETQLEYAHKTGAKKVEGSSICQRNIMSAKPIEPEFDPEKLNKFIKHEGDMKDIEILSPWRVSKDNDLSSYEMLEGLYHEDDYLFIGNNYSTEVKQVKEWIHDNNLPSHPLFIPNPLTGANHETTLGKMSKRCDKAVRQGRYAVVEMDEVDMQTQINFWLTMLHIDMPVALITFSGKKSLHGLLRVDCPIDEWQEKVANILFMKYLVVLGVDKMCRNPSRLSRVPGHVRAGVIQRMLYLRMDKFQ